jgi:hypothetical protein
MNENQKLAEAQYFLSHLGACALNPDAFTFELSAFLSAARSVLQYACKEAKPKQGGQAWYDAHINATPVLTYFRGKRNVNIHQEPVGLHRHILVQENVSVSLHASVSLTGRDPDGNVIGERMVSSPAPQPIPPSVSYHFSDWPQPNENEVETLCSRYLVALETVVNDGQAQGFLSK